MGFLSTQMQQRIHVRYLVMSLGSVDLSKSHFTYRNWPDRQSKLRNKCEDMKNMNIDYFLKFSCGGKERGKMEVYV